MNGFRHRPTFLFGTIFLVASFAAINTSVGADDVMANPADKNVNSSEPELQFVDALIDGEESDSSASEANAESGSLTLTPAAVRRYRDPMLPTVEKAINSARRRYLDAGEHTPWQIMHGLLGLRYGFYIKQNNRLVHGLSWISVGQEFEGSSWFEKVNGVGRAHSYTRPYAFQGHANQFLAIISMAGIPLTHEFKTADGEVVTVQDMVNNAKMEISADDELAWTLWALSRYLPPDAEWLNKDGEPWSIEQIVESQVRKPINNRTYCGGTHCMFSLAHARNIYLRSGKPLRGIWLEADQKIKKHIQIAKKLQNRDGMFSTDYFNSREYNKDFSERIASAGHILEFLMLAVSQREMRETWVRKGVLALAKDLVANANSSAKCGPLYHTVDGLVIYLDRTQPGAVRRLMAQNASSMKIAAAQPATKSTKPVAPKKEAETKSETKTDAKTAAKSDEEKANKLSTTAAGETEKPEAKTEPQTKPDTDNNARDSADETATTEPSKDEKEPSSTSKSSSSRVKFRSPLKRGWKRTRKTEPKKPDLILDSETRPAKSAVLKVINASKSVELDKPSNNEESDANEGLPVVEDLPGTDATATAADKPAADSDSESADKVLDKAAE